MKRFTETGKWDDPWFMGLSLEAKAVWQLLCDKCDSAGVWDPNKPLVNFLLKRDVEWDTVLIELGDRIRILENGKWWLTGFVGFQYGKLSEECKPHASVIAMLCKHGIRYEPLNGHKVNTVSKPYPKGIDTPKDKDKETEKDKDRIGGLEERDQQPELGLKEANKKFVPPTPGEVESYSKEIGYPLDGSAWCDKYIQKGWLVGKTKMKDWKAAIRNWKANNWKPNSDSNGGGAVPWQRDSEASTDKLAHGGTW